MDIQLKKKPWYVRYRLYLAGGVLLLAGLIYVVILASGPQRLRIDADSVQLAEVKQAPFREYVDVEGVVHPILTLMVNARESGNVARIVAEEGSLLQQGATIYELNKIRKSFALEQEEYRMGIRSKAQLEVSEDEYRYKTASTQLKMQSLQSDSAMTVIGRELLRNDREREQKKLERSLQRMEELVVRAPTDGQLSFVKVTLGQQVAAGENLAEVKVMSQFKVHASLSEYYVDRVTVGLPASVTYQGKRYALKVSKVVPEVKDRTFDVDLVFTGEMPENVRLGKSFRVQIELGQPEQALVIPRGNFYSQTGGQWIYKLNADKTRARRVPVVIGRQNPLQYEITEGLQPGDWVITTGYDNFGDAEELVFK